MVALGLSHRSRPGNWLAAAAAPLVHRGLSGHCYVYSAIGRNTARKFETREALSADRGVHVRETVRIERPVAELYRFWRQLDNLPRFMKHLERVTDLGGGRSHWVAKGPGDFTFEWDAEIINEMENQVIGWRSLPDSDVITAGSVTFKPVRNGQSTEITIHLQYTTAGGKVGSAVASMMGREPSQMIREDLRRLKQIVEAGEIPRARRTH
jgi:uncharacterized membrane protein